MAAKQKRNTHVYYYKTKTISSYMFCVQGQLQFHYFQISISCIMISPKDKPENADLCAGGITNMCQSCNFLQYCGLFAAPLSLSLSQSCNCKTVFALPHSSLFQKGNKNEWISPRLQEQNRHFPGRTNYVGKT